LNKFWSLKFILLDKYIKLATKREVLETCVFPALLYGCQTWSPTSKERKMLQVCQRKMESKILRLSIKDRTRNADVRKQLGTRYVLQTAAQLKWKWGGHVSRLHESRWAYASTMWDPKTGKRNVGRPRTRWSALFNEIVGRQWTRVARNRAEWRRLEKSLRAVQTL
jgi:hypothetical protein